jgi:hypothetical protein
LKKLEKVFEKCESLEVKMGGLGGMGDCGARGDDWFALFELVHILEEMCAFWRMFRQYAQKFFRRGLTPIYADYHWPQSTQSSLRIGRLVCTSAGLFSMPASAEGTPLSTGLPGNGKAFSEADQMSHIYSTRRSAQRGGQVRTQALHLHQDT